MLPHAYVDQLLVEEGGLETSKTYAVDFQNGRIVGWIDGIDAVRQAYEKILSTERFAHEIYTANYGVELSSLFGKDMPYVKTVLENRIREAVMADERTLELQEFKINEISKDTLECRGIIKTVDGIVDIYRRITI